MNLSILNFIVTQECNFNCAYCRQKKNPNYLSTEDIEKFLDFFRPHLAQECSVTFYGGEPLLAFNQIRRAVDMMEARQKGWKTGFNYTVTTNGTLLNRDIIRFLNRHRFAVNLSYDGSAQEIYRKKGSSRQLLDLIPRLLAQPGIEFMVISVFTPATVTYLYESVASILDMGVPRIRLSLDLSQPWKEDSLSRLQEEFRRLVPLLVEHYRERQAVALSNFLDYESKGIFFCGAGHSRLTLAPGGILWGCHRAWSYFCGREERRDYKKYNFGSLGDFIDNREEIYPKILGHYNNLRQDYAWTPEKFCAQCEEVQECDICPFAAASSGCVIGKIPGWVCQLIRLERQEKKNFLNRLKSIDS